MEFLNGKKTYIGAVIYAAGQVLTQTGYPELGKALTELGTVIMAVGFAHKIDKVSR